MPKTQLDAAATAEMLKAVAEAIIAAEPLLSEADRKLGDGDHGIGMQRGMTAVLEKLAAAPAATPGKAFSTVGMAMMSSMGGASGALFGTFFRNAGKAIGDAEQLDAAGFAAAAAAGSDGVISRGGAKPGDKTMVDALVPAATRAAEVADLPLSEAMAEVAAAAEAGREASIALLATMGRAKTLGERSIGHPDAGACSVAIIYRAMADFAAA